MGMQEQAPWFPYDGQPPTAEGEYLWRVPSRIVPGISIVFVAHMRRRGAGHHDVISPVFDYWDGYRVHVPQGTEWRHLPAPIGSKRHEITALSIDGLAHEKCLYCGRVPRLNGCQRTNTGGVVISGDPHMFNRWWLTCCEWGKTPHLNDPRELERIRAAAIAKAKEL